MRRRAVLSAELYVAVVVPAAARADVLTFVPTDAEQTFMVPAGVTSVHAVAVGGKGGDGASSGGAGGCGALVSADFAVMPGQVLYIEVGGNGSTGNTSASAGFNGGGDGEAGPSCDGGGGGGASDVRLAPRSVGTSLSLRLITAAGGGCGSSAGGGGGGGSSGFGAPTWRPCVPTIP